MLNALMVVVMSLGEQRLMTRGKELVLTNSLAMRC